MRDGEEDCLSEQRTEELDFLLVTGWAEPSPFTGERQEVFVFAVVAADPGETALKVAAVEELVHNFRDDGAKKPHLGLEFRLTVVQKLVEMVVQALPKRGILEFRGR
jgi:hypothetical protein